MVRLITSLLLVTLLTGRGTLAQGQSVTASPTVSGKITYEGLRRIDLSQMRQNGNGPGGGEAPEGMPDVISFTQKLVFAGSYAKEERDRPQNPMRQNRAGNGTNPPDGAPAGGTPTGGPGAGMRMMRMNDQETYLDLVNRQRISIMTVRRDSSAQRYRTDRPFPKPDGWQLSDKTKKVAGYVCHKATVTRRNAPYTIWYTTDLPFTYSPIADLTPDTGVVLQIESDDESFKASGVSLEAVDMASLHPPTDVKTISPEEMEQIRRKQMADFRQRMMQNGGLPGRN